MKTNRRDSRHGLRLLTLCAAATGVLGSVDVAAQQAVLEIEEIVVTARRVEEKLVEVPVAVTAFTGEQLARANVTSLADIAAFTPGFSFEAYSGGTTPAPLIRGLTQTALTDRNQNVGTFVDGIHVQQQGNVDFTLMDLERIEIIKGPQNAQYGRSSFAGAINWVPAKPKLGEWGGSVGLTFGSDERKDYSASINIPIGETLAIRAYGKKTEFDGVFKNNFPGAGAAVRTTGLGGNWAGTEGNVGGWDNDAAQVSLRFEPTDELALNVMYYRSHARNEPGAGYVIQPVTLAQLPMATAAQLNPHNCSPNAMGVNQLRCGNIPISESQVFHDPRNTGAQTHSELWSGRLDYRFSENLSLMYLYGRGNYDNFNYQSGTQPELLVTGNPLLGGLLIFGSNPGTDQQAQTHELRFDGKIGNVGWRLGYFAEDLEDLGAFAAFTFRRPLAVDPTNSFASSGSPLGPDGLLSKFNDKIRSPFGSVSIPFSDRWTVDVEARYTKEDRSQSSRALVTGANSFVRTTTFNEEFTDFTPRVNLSWKPREGWNFYASAARGTKSGGFNGVTADEPTYEPEENTTIEIGGKQTLWDRRLQLNYAVFATDWKDLQFSVPDTVPSGLTPPGTQEGNYIGNVKGAEAIGVEVDAQAALTERLVGRFAASYVDSTFKSGTIDSTFGRLCETTGTPVCVFLPRQPGVLPLGGSPIGGNDLPRTPKTQIAVGLDYRIPIGSFELTMRGDLTYQSKYFAESLNLASIPDRTLLNLDVGIADPDGVWSVNVWGKNVTDELYASSAFSVSVVNQYVPALGLGATFGVTGRYNFAPGK